MSTTIHANQEPVLIVMSGIPGSGKSTEAENIMVERNGEYTKPSVFSSDGIRAELFGDPSIQGNNQEIFSILRERVAETLSEGGCAVYDATNISPWQREQALSTADGMDVTKVSVCMGTSLEQSKEQNAGRDRNVPDAVIERMWNNYSYADESEGFDAVVISDGSDIDIDVRDFQEDVDIKDDQTDNNMEAPNNDMDYEDDYDKVD